MKSVIKNSLFFGGGIFVLYSILHFIILDENISLDRVLFISLITVLSTVTWGGITYFTRKNKAQ